MSMSKDQLTLLISLFAVGLSATSLGWNIYRDIILKPRVKVRMSVRGLFAPGLPRQEPLMKILVTAVNFGPSDVFCQSVLAKNASPFRRLTRRVENWFIIQESPQLPQKISVGQQIDILIPYERHGPLAKSLTHFGVADSYGRIHWAGRRDLQSALKQYRKDFGANNSENGRPTALTS
jgi:hypothetical protein